MSVHKQHELMGVHKQHELMGVHKQHELVVVHKVLFAGTSTDTLILDVLAEEIPIVRS